MSGDILSELFSILLQQVSIFFLLPAAAGLIIYLMEVWITGRLLTAFGEKAIWFTALPGTLVHESAHALACLLFRCPIKEIRFWTFDESSGVLGFVKYTYSQRNPLHWIGRMVIGFAPLMAGFSILWLVWTLIPGENILSTGLFAQVIHKWSSLMGSVSQWEWYIGILVWIILGITVHMAPSWQDLKGTWPGLVLSVFLLAGINAALLAADITPTTGYSFVHSMLPLLLFFVSVSVGFALLITLITAPFIRIRTGHW